MTLDLGAVCPKVMKEEDEYLLVFESEPEIEVKPPPVKARQARQKVVVEGLLEFHLADLAEAIYKALPSAKLRDLLLAITKDTLEEISGDDLKQLLQDEDFGVLGFRSWRIARTKLQEIIRIAQEVIEEEDREEEE